MLKLTYTAHGAHLSDENGYVTHELIRPGVGTGPLDGGQWSMCELIGPYTKRSVGSFDTPEAARDAAQEIIMNSTPRVLRVVKGNRRIGLRKHDKLTVLEVEPRGADYSHQCSVKVRRPNGLVSVLWVVHANRIINDPEFNLGNGSGVDKVRVSVDAWNRPELVKCTRCANANWVLIGHSCGKAN